MTYHYFLSWTVNVMQIKARLLRCSNGTHHSADEYWHGFPYGSQTGEVGKFSSCFVSTLPFSHSMGRPRQTASRG